MTLMAVESVAFGYSAAQPVLRDVSLTVRQGTSLGLVGESGSGKSTLLRLMLGLHRPSSGIIRYDGARLQTRDAGFMRGFRREVQAVFQDPYSSLDPRQTILAIVTEPLRSLRIAGDHIALASAALTSVGLEAGMLARYPHQFSGGQRQRIAMARAIVAGPRLLLADEAVSALDLSTRIRIVELFKRLAVEMTLVFVSHDLGVVAALCEEIAILEKGRIVEAGPTRKILDDPQHPYTRTLLSSVPRMPA